MWHTHTHAHTYTGTHRCTHEYPKHTYIGQGHTYTHSCTHTHMLTPHTNTHVLIPYTPIHTWAHMGTDMGRAHPRTLTHGQDTHPHVQAVVSRKQESE